MRLIDADALMDKVNNTFAPFVTLLSDAPTIDAVQVIHCKDCRYMDETKSGKYYFCAKGHNILSDVTFFCRDGERREHDT